MYKLSPRTLLQSSMCAVAVVAARLYRNALCQPPARSLLAAVQFQAFRDMLIHWTIQSGTTDTVERVSPCAKSLSQPILHVVSHKVTEKVYQPILFSQQCEPNRICQTVRVVKIDLATATFTLP